MPARVLLVGGVLEIVVAMEVEDAQQLLTELNSANGVSARVQRRRPREDAGHVGDDQQNAAADSGFGRQPDLERKLTGIVVHAAAVHQREDVAHDIGPENFLFGGWADAAVGERRRHDTHRVRARLHRADLEVIVQALPQVRLLREDFVLAHVEAERVVSIGRLSFRKENRVVEAKVLATSHPLEPVLCVVKLFSQRHFRFHQSFHQGTD